MLSSLLLLASLLPLLVSPTLYPPPLTSAIPPFARQQETSRPFALIATRSASPIHLQSINANNGTFWIGKETHSYCPFPETPNCCPAGTATVFAVNNTAGTARLEVEVPGGQSLYVLPTGLLAFTPGHAEGGGEMQNEGTATGFSYRNSTAGALGVFRFRGLNATGFLACPTRNGTAPWQVFADVEGLALRSPSVPGGNVSACLGFNALGVNFRGAGAWEYV